MHALLSFLDTAQDLRVLIQSSASQAQNDKPSPNQQQLQQQLQQQHGHLQPQQQSSSMIMGAECAMGGNSGDGGLLLSGNTKATTTITHSLNTSPSLFTPKVSYAKTNRF